MMSIIKKKGGRGLFGQCFSFYNRIMVYNDQQTKLIETGLNTEYNTKKSYCRLAVYLVDCSSNTNIYFGCLRAHFLHIQETNLLITVSMLTMHT
jgi:hypothetical protein